MSKLINKYKELKQNDSTTLYLFKSGIFYIFLDKDAKLMSPLLNLKLTNLNSEVLKCGFPINSLNKYISKLDETSYKIKIIDPNNNNNNSLSLNNEKVKKLFDKISKIDINNLSVKESFELLDYIKKEISNITKGVN